MLVDRSLRLAVRNFSTLFLVVFVVIAPLHLLYGLVFQDVVALRELHPAIAEFPETRLVRGVGRADIAQAKVWFWVLVLVEVAALPILTRPVRRVLVMDANAEVPTVVHAYRRRSPDGGSRLPVVETSGPAAAALVVVVCLALAGGVLARLILGRVVELLPDAAASLGMAIADATARSGAAAVVLTAAVLAFDARRTVPTERTPDLY
ncbi:MAG TPA: hypothetical protein VJ927_08215 [Actinomycetota bacterium]|nr:hypothetical protein [Actinomycetota bacterium]